MTIGLLPQVTDPSAVHENSFNYAFEMPPYSHCIASSQSCTCNSKIGQMCAKTQRRWSQEADILLHIPTLPV